MTHWQLHRRGLTAACEAHDTPNGRELVVTIRGVVISNEMVRAVPAREGLEDEWRQMFEGYGWTNDAAHGPPSEIEKGRVGRDPKRW